MRGAVYVGLLAVLAACQTQGTYIDDEQVDQLQGSISTAQELEVALGIPTVTIPRDDGSVMWVYEGVFTRPGATAYIPYLNYLVGTNAKRCTRLSVLVDRETGRLSNWSYSTSKDLDLWYRRDDRCAPPGSMGASDHPAEP
jgi:hypothetical protein